MNQHKLLHMVSVVLVVVLLFNMAVPAMAQETDHTVSQGNQTENPLTADYVVPDWEEDADSPLVKSAKPSVYRSGKILIYHYSQLLMVGSGVPVTDADYIVNRLGEGERIFSADGNPVVYGLNCEYQIVQDIALPRHTGWRIPDNFTGEITGNFSADGSSLYSEENDTIYLCNPLQLAVMTMDDADYQPVMSGDTDTSTFGTGTVIYPDGEENYLTYSGKHNYVIAKGFSSDLTNRSVSVRVQNRGAPLRAAASQYDGRDFQGQVIKKLNDGNDTYILIGNQEQLRAIGTDKDVFSAVYQTDYQVTNGYVLDTDDNGRLERVHIKRASKIIANMITDRKMESSLS